MRPFTTIIHFISSSQNKRNERRQWYYHYDKNVGFVLDPTKTTIWWWWRWRWLDPHDIIVITVIIRWVPAPASDRGSRHGIDAHNNHGCRDHRHRRRGDRASPPVDNHRFRWWSSSWWWWGWGWERYYCRRYEFVPSTIDRARDPQDRDESIVITNQYMLSLCWVAVLLPSS